MSQVKTPSYQAGLKDLRQALQGMLPAEALKTFDADAESLQAHYPEILKLKTGDSATPFSLSNALGESVSLQGLLKNGRVVLTFYRGTWCPYCNLMLAQYQQILPEIKAAGAQLVAISPQTPDELLNIKEKNELQFEVLSDPGNLVARAYTTVFKYGDEPRAVMANLGYDFDSFYTDDSGEIPVPATFVIEQDGRISFARSEGADYRNRVEASEILLALSA